jgi:hypothetical protein
MATAACHGARVSGAVDGHETCGRETYCHSSVGFTEVARSNMLHRQKAQHAHPSAPQKAFRSDVGRQEASNGVCRGP